MEPRLAEMLASMIGEKWLEPIGNLGVHTIDDLRYLSQEDLKGRCRVRRTWEEKKKGARTPPSCF